MGDFLVGVLSTGFIAFVLTVANYDPKECSKYGLIGKEPNRIEACVEWKRIAD